MIVVAATSARMLAESARRAGLRPVALDLFGDLDTRQAAHWIRIGRRGQMTIDSRRLRVALTRLKRLPGVLGWIAGGGFEDRPGTLADCAQALALIGNDAATISAIKQPGSFFSMLDEFGIEHPETRLGPPPTSAGWLSKHIGGTGGWHVQRLARCDDRPRRAGGADAMPPLQASYYQRESAGVPMSVLFLANGAEVCIVGFNRLLSGPIGDRPFVFQGGVGPVTLPAAAAQTVRRAVRQIVRRTALVGLNSMDFLLAGDRVSVTEINPRPSATLDLHDDRLEGGLLNAHLAACSRRVLPHEESVPPPPPAHSASVRGYRIVHAQRQLRASRESRRRLCRLDWCHDISPEGTLTRSGEPLCSVSAQAGTAAEVVARLARRVRDVQRINEDDHGH